MLVMQLQHFKFCDKIFLRGVFMADIFDSLTKSQKSKVLYNLEAHTFTFQKNINILNSINTKNFMGIVLYGELEIIKNEYNGTQTLIEKLHDNSIFGSVISSLNSNEYEAYSKEETKVIIIDYNRILNNDNTALYMQKFLKNLLEIISIKITEKNERIEILTKKTIRDKILEYFKIMKNKVGTNIIYLPMNYSSLANFLAVDRSAMTREMRNLIDEGFIKKDNKKITLLYE